MLLNFGMLEPSILMQTINSSKIECKLIVAMILDLLTLQGANFDAKFGLKYYKDGASSAFQQSKKYF